MHITSIGHLLKVCSAGCNDIEEELQLLTNHMVAEPRGLGPSCWNLCQAVICRDGSRQAVTAFCTCCHRCQGILHNNHVCLTQLEFSGKQN